MSISAVLWDDRSILKNRAPIPILARKQYNYLISEEETIGPNGTLTHGPNAVISMLHHCIETRNLGEKVLTLHADNCPGNIIVII